jgi:hypothetical protein
MIKNTAVVLEPLPDETLLRKSLANTTGVSIIGVGNK